MWRLERAGACALMAAAAFALTSCSGADLSNAAERCGGEDAGIVDDDGVITYFENMDSTDGSAWTCLASDLLDDEHAYQIAMSIDDGKDSGSVSSNGINVEWKRLDTFGIVMEFSQ